MGNKLELTWYGKEKKFKIEPRLLIENKELSNTEFDADTENMLIHGDNLLALKALKSKYAGKVKCVYIDPPYNTGSAFEHYDDNIEHSQWLSLIKPRLELLRNLLSDDGSIWISIDADESHYLKVLCDEIFGRKNFIDEIVWQRSYAPINLKKTLSRSHDTILVYGKNKGPEFSFNKLPRSKEASARYKNPDNDPRGLWQSDNLSVGPIIKEKVYEIITPAGRSVFPPDGYCWRLTKERYFEFLRDNRIWFGANGKGVPRIKRFLSEVKDGVTAMTFWPYQEIGHNQDAKKEVKKFNSEDVFATPKAEKLIERILTLGSNEGDLILDSFLGSGTTAAVAHKMNRKWIGIEMGYHAYSHCKVRLDKVISGEDAGGISKSVNWKGGGGYKFYELAPSLINIDSFDEPVINKEYSADMLASAVALHEGFNYQPAEDIFWKQSVGNENSYLFVTTRHLTAQYVDSIKDTMADNEYLIIACRSFDTGLEKAHKQITIKKIPNMLLAHCEFDKDNYNLNIIDPPVYDEFEEDEIDE